MSNTKIIVSRHNPHVIKVAYRAGRYSHETTQVHMGLGHYLDLGFVRGIMTRPLPLKTRMRLEREVLVVLEEFAKNMT